MSAADIRSEPNRLEYRFTHVSLQTTFVVPIRSTMSKTSTETPGETERTAALSETDKHELLTAERRRAALSVLDRRTSPVELSDLAAEVAEREPGPDAECPDTVRRVKLTLHHVHLPKMDALDAIDYDTCTKQATL